MRKVDEVTLFAAVTRECRQPYAKSGDRSMSNPNYWLLPKADAIAVSLSIPHKRYLFLFEKWADQGIYEYGTSAEHGWLTPKGMELHGVLK